VRGKVARVRWLAALATVAFVATPVRTASAVDPSGPVITSHVDNEPVSGAITVRASTSAPYLLLAWAPTADLEYPVEVVEGVADATLSTSGYDGPATIIARECSSPPVCEGPQTSVQVDVANPPPTFSDGTWVSEWHGGDIAYWGTEEGPWAWYAGFFDGKYVPSVPNYPFFTVPASELGDGEHTVQIARCTEPPDKMPIIEPPVCDMANASEVRTFTLRTALHPTIAGVRHRTISPNGDDARDLATVTATADTRQITRWELLRGSETVATGNSGERAPGPYTFTVDGLDESGTPLPSGTYELRLRAFSLPSSDPGVDDRMITGETSTTITVDLDAPTITDVSVTPRLFHPPVDGYRDRTRLAGTLDEPVRRLHVQLRRDGRVVRTLRLGSQPAGRFSTAWDGRVPVDRLAKPGAYWCRYVARDWAGNQATAAGGWVHVRWRR
jgi:hypothetical protein